ncbi:hypothetical protein [Zhihengliuella halotolerans]|uniref:PH (Pleckstrin Homology) domain-containing protein n=1 Tax=Zhihengliuella halotolerans TaxID=370736 RepID=A0A4Q8AGS6_9MICC|nr:hypothetical protein [Zhihengliuella halotolerans]RZU63597.1 hypothetical protein EV380_3218 [Zhihengliuella halotolerans]
MTRDAPAASRFPEWDRAFDSTGTLHFRTGRHVSVLALLGCLVFVAAGFWMLGVERPLAAIAGVLALLFFGVMGVPTCVYLFFKPRSLTFTADGVLITRRPLIPWEAVAGAGHVTQGPQTHGVLRLTPEGMAAYEGALTGRAARVHASQKSYTGGDGAFFPPYLPASPRDIAAWVNANRHRLATS